MSAEKLAPIANELNLEYRVFNVKDASGYLQDVTVLLNCAGPFSATAEVLVKACLTQKVHYLDITGEIDVFRKCYALDNEAKKQHIIIMPGVGTDIVPTDCLAAMLKEKLPASHPYRSCFFFWYEPEYRYRKNLHRKYGKRRINQGKRSAQNRT